MYNAFRFIVDISIFLIVCTSNQITGIDGVNILPNSTEIIVNAGDSFNLTCQGNKPLKWQLLNYEPIEDDIKSTSNTTYSEENGKYESILQIHNAYFLDTGYIYCFPEGGDIDSIESDKIYLYVKDENHLLAVNDSYSVLYHSQHSDVLLPCRPTSPDVEVVLKKDENVVPIGKPESGIDVKYYDKLGFIFPSISEFNGGDYVCKGTTPDNPQGTETYYIIVVIPHTDYVPKPSISQEPSHAIVGHQVNLTCSCKIPSATYPTITWTVPSPDAVKKGHILIMNNTLELIETSREYRGIGSLTLIIYNTTKKDEGTYVCHVVDHNNKTNQDSYQLKVFHANEKYLNLSLIPHLPLIVAEPGSPSIQWVVKIEAYPAVQEMKWYDPKGVVISGSNTKYSVDYNKVNGMNTLKVHHPEIENSGEYKFEVKNDEVNIKVLNVTLLVKSFPNLEIIRNDYDYYKVNKTHTVECQVMAYPPPVIEWYFQTCVDYPKCERKYNLVPKEKYHELVIQDQVYIKSSVTLNTQTSGMLQCVACNQLSKIGQSVCSNETVPYLLIEVENGFDAFIETNHKGNLVVEQDNIILQCGASKYNYSSNLEWFYHNSTTNEVTPIQNSDTMKIMKFETNFSHFANLYITNIKKLHSGEYTCLAHDRFRPKLETSERKLKINVRNLEKPKLRAGSNMGRKTTLATGKSLKWHCFADGMPPPVIIWYKGDQQVKRNTSRIHIQDEGQTLFIEFLSLDDDGIYKCVIKNRVGEITHTGEVILIDKTELLYWWVLLGVILLVCFIVIGWLVRANLKQRKIQLELSKAGLLDFEKGNIESLNPDLDPQDQADLLPYNKNSWEFPREKLQLGKLLGSGAFGIVKKAEAIGLIEDGVSTTVAVKTVQKNCDLSYIKALASELKIMSHLGKHLNVVNLLGACTANLTNKELFVIVEYCRYGNLHQYLLKHRDTFINQVNTRTGEFEPTVIHSPTVTSPGLKYADLNFSYSGKTSNGQSGNRQSELITSDGSTKSAQVGEDGYLVMREPEWKSNYRGDYKGTSVRPICTQDLFCWGFQVARGMEYLASRKVMHGDLAARNILLADDNVVKICDFGFSKSMYKDESYHKKGDGPLPVKWMSIEAIRDRVFSTQSDIWSFGIVLWEFFSLAKTPYPGMEADERLFQRLSEGYRMEKPKYASNDAYKVMLECWHNKPTLRPSFTELAERLGDMLENTVRSHYVDMNDPYLKLNAEFLAQEDYLSMLSPPTYSNWQPSTEDYLAMKPSLTDAREAMELAPMLNQVTGEVNSDTESTPNSPINLQSTSRVTEKLSEQTGQQLNLQTVSSDESKPTVPDVPNIPVEQKPQNSSHTDANQVTEGNNYVNVSQAIGFANPSYHNLGRPKLNPYMNVPTSPTER